MTNTDTRLLVIRNIGACFELMCTADINLFKNKKCEICAFQKTCIHSIQTENSVNPLYFLFILRPMFVIVLKSGRP